MFNLKVNIIAAGAAFFLSFLLGIISKSHMPVVFIRPVIFAVVFFVLFAMIQILINRFLPELLEGSAKEESDELFPGSRIDITEDEPMASPRDYTARETAAHSSVGARPDESEKEMGDISQLGRISRAANQEPLDADQEPFADGTPLADGTLLADVDQSLKSDYTDTGEVEETSMYGQSEPMDTGSAPPPEEKRATPSSEMPDFFLTNTIGITPSDEVLPDLDSMAGAFASSSANDESETGEFSASTSSKKASSNKSQGWSGDFVPKDIATGLRTVLIKDKEA